MTKSDKKRKREIDKEASPITQTREDENYEEDESIKSKSKKNKSIENTITVVNNITRLNELTYACVQAYKEQYHKFQGMKQDFDHMSNIDRIVKKQIETTLITGGMDEDLAFEWEGLDFDEVLQGLLRGLSSKEANSFADELRKIKFTLTDPVDSTKLNEWILKIVTLESKYESYLLEIKKDVEENKALVKILTDQFSEPNASKGLKRLKQLLAGKKIDNIDELIRQVSITLRDEKKYCLAARYWGYELPYDKPKTNFKTQDFKTQDLDIPIEENKSKLEIHNSSEKTKADTLCSACGSKKHDREDCGYLKKEDKEVNYSTIVPWKTSQAGIQCFEKYGWTQLPPTKVRESLTAKK
jgi:hypothetical protein